MLNSREVTCQFWWHPSRSCNARPRCVKCTGDRGSTECSRAKEAPEPPACILCKRVGHPASYLGCECATKRQIHVKKPVPVPAKSERASRYTPVSVPAVSAWAKPPAALQRHVAVSRPTSPKPTPDALISVVLIKHLVLLDAIWSLMAK